MPARSSNPPPRVPTRLRTIDETAELLAVSKRTIQRLIKSGALRAHHVRRARRISDAEIAAFLDANRDD
jgi:excisionase family DNA binding protein